MCTICFDESALLFTLGEHACDINHNYCQECLTKLAIEHDAPYVIFISIQKYL